MLVTTKGKPAVGNSNLLRSDPLFLAT
jgi:hypothetical protein